MRARSGSVFGENVGGIGRERSGRRAAARRGKPRKCVEKVILLFRWHRIGSNGQCRERLVGLLELHIEFNELHGGAGERQVVRGR